MRGADLATADLAELAAAFAGRLRTAGVPVAPDRAGWFIQCLAGALPATVDELYWAGRVTLLTSHDDIEVYDRVFAHVFRGLADVAILRGDPNQPLLTDVRPGRDRTDRSGPDGRESVPSGQGRPLGTTAPLDGTEAPTLLAVASTIERLRTKDFAAWTADELALLRVLIAELPLSAPLRTSRRHERRRHGDRLDLRATLRRARRTGGDPATHVLRRRRRRPRRIVLLADVSGSMEPYARAYLHLMHGAVRATRAEAFVFATRLTRLTRELQATDPDRALQRAAAATPDWSGGTRIGRALHAFNNRYGRRGLARGAVVVIVSDGWELDDPALLGQEMARLARLAHRIVWANPRMASDRYRPLVGGMTAALPHIDTMVSGHSPAAMASLLAALQS